MARSNNKNIKGRKRKTEPLNDVRKKEAIVTMQALREMSDEDEDDELPSESEWDEKAKALKQAIESGQFDQAIEKSKGETGDDLFEEATLDDDDDDVIQNDPESAACDNEEDENNENMSAHSGQHDDGDEEDDSEDQQHTSATSGPQISVNAENEEEQDDVDDEDDDEDEDTQEHEEDDEKVILTRPNTDQKNSYHAKALRVLVEELDSQTKFWPWAERFDVLSKEPLPFDDPNAGVSIHDDLKREVTFYDIALKATLQAKNQCKDAGIPFSRPEDFFAEMVKSDEHMARVKDRLIFETKKMDAVAQRKANKEQKLRSKESKANKQAEKSKRKKDHFRAVEEWAESAKSNRGQRLDDRDNVDSHFPQKNRKREWADKKYGRGGPRGRFKQNDPASMNDLSSYNPNGNFLGGGTKLASSKRKKNGSGANRPGKRARDAKRSGQR